MLQISNIPPQVVGDAGLLIVICLFVAAALLLKGDNMAELFRGAVAALLTILIKTLEKQVDTEHDDDSTEKQD